MTFDPKISFIKRPKYIPKKRETTKKEVLTNILVDKIDIKDIQ